MAEPWTEFSSGDRATVEPPAEDQGPWAQFQAKPTTEEPWKDFQPEQAAPVKPPLDPSVITAPRSPDQLAVQNFQARQAGGFPSPGDVSKPGDVLGLPFKAGGAVIADILNRGRMESALEGTAESQPRQFVVAPDELRMESPQDQKQRTEFRGDKPLLPVRGTSIDPEGSDMERLLSQWSTPESLAMLPAGMSRAGAALMITQMVPQVARQIKDVAKGEGTETEKRDRINNLFAMAILAAHGAAKGEKGPPKPPEGPAPLAAAPGTIPEAVPPAQQTPPEASQAPTEASAAKPAPSAQWTAEDRAKFDEIKSRLRSEPDLAKKYPISRELIALQNKYGGENPPEAAPETPAAPLEHTLESVGKLNSAEFFDTAAQWAKDAMAGKGKGPQLMAEAAARANPDLAAWEKGQSDAGVEYDKIKGELEALRPDPKTATEEQKKAYMDAMMARQNEVMGIAQKGQFYSEGIKQIKKTQAEATKPAAPSTKVVRAQPAEGAPTVPYASLVEPAPAAAPAPAALAAKQQPGLPGVASDWTSATEEAPTPTPAAGKPATSSLVNPPTAGMEASAGIPIPKFANRKMSPLDRVTASHSGKLQKSFDEARRAQREITKGVRKGGKLVEPGIPSVQRQNAASIYREAGGDIAKLKDWETRAKQKWMRDGARDAQTLNPDEIAVVKKAEAAFAAMEGRGKKFDVLRSHRDNYIPHVWDVKTPGTGTGWGSTMLKQRFRFSKARTFDTFFDGDQAGFKPKTLAIGKLLPAYIHEMNKVIADRQAVRDIAAGVNADGSPMAVPRGNAKVVEGDEGKAVLVQPRAMKEADTSDYRVMADQPALANWTWASKDTAGRPVFMKSDLALHPDAYRRVNAMIGQSALRSWYHDPVTGLAQIPRAVVRGLDTAQGAMKREMFGLLAPFHQVQEGTHGIGHMVNPFSHIPKIDLRDPAQFDAANHGLMLLPDRASARVYLEGVGAKSSLLSQGIRKVGRAGEAVSDVIDGYQDYLFHQYIPGLKFKTYQAILGRNMKLYADELTSGEMTESDVKITSAEQANAAYGHQNYALLDRNPTIQHMIQIAALAPDFLEARARFAGQAIKGLTSKVGHEQLKAIAILAAVQAGSAFVISNATGGSWDPRHPFEVIHNGRRYAMRSVPEDIFSLLKDRRQFIYARVNPLIVKGGIQLATGLNYRGEKVSALDTFEELLAGYIPITARQLPGLRSLTATSRQNPVSPLQQLAGSLGLRVSRYSPVTETYKLAGKWMDSQKMDRSKGSYPISKYQQLGYALEDGDMDSAKGHYDDLVKKMTPELVARGFKQSINHPFTGKKSSDEDFAASLKGHDRELYDQALRTRENILNGFDSLEGQ